MLQTPSIFVCFCLASYVLRPRQQQQGKSEILQAFQRLLVGLGDGASVLHKDIYKLGRSCLTDKSMSVRCAAARVSCIAP